MPSSTGSGGGPPATRRSPTRDLFTDLGEQAVGEITRLWAKMRAQAGNPPGEDYLARVAVLDALRKQAEEIVLADLILLPPELSPYRGSRMLPRGGCSYVADRLEESTRVTLPIWPAWQGSHCVA